jgi:hypothetical protein
MKSVDTRDGRLRTAADEEIGAVLSYCTKLRVIGEMVAEDPDAAVASALAVRGAELCRRMLTVLAESDPT